MNRGAPMSNYRRYYQPGGTWFFTVRLADRSSRLLVEEVATLRAAVALARARWPFEIDTAVVLPAEAHMIWTLPPGDSDFPARWRLIKSAFSRQMPPVADLRPSLAKKGERGIWQRRYWEHLIRDEGDLALHRHFCVTAPVRAGLVRRASDWPHSSLHRDRARGAAFETRVAGYWPASGKVGLDPPYAH